jgi:hypothetical protein
MFWLDKAKADVIPILVSYLAGSTELEIRHDQINEQGKDTYLLPSFSLGAALGVFAVRAAVPAFSLFSALFLQWNKVDAGKRFATGQ